MAGTSRSKLAKEQRCETDNLGQLWGLSLSIMAELTQEVPNQNRVLTSRFTEAETLLCAASPL